MLILCSGDRPGVGRGVAYPRWFRVNVLILVLSLIMNLNCTQDQAIDDAISIYGTCRASIFNWFSLLEETGINLKISKLEVKVFCFASLRIFFLGVRNENYLYV